MSVVRGVLRRAGTTTRSSAGDRAFAVYAAVLVLLIVVAPVGRALWIILVRADVTAGIAAVPVSAVLAGVLAAWSGAMIVGVTWGPAARSPWLTSVLAAAPLSRIRAFGGPVAALAVLAALGIAGLVALVALAISTALPPAAAWVWPLIGLATGLGATSAAVIGQRFGVQARWAAGIGVIVAAAAAFIPSGTVGDTQAWWVQIGVLCMAAGMTWLAVWSLRTMPSTALSQAASQTEAARDGLSVLDVTRVAELARALPQLGRRWRAVRPPLPRFALFAIRAAVGLARTPDRFVIGFIGLMLGALACTSSSWIVTGIGCIVMATALSSFADGVRHAASSASLLYGIARWHLLLLHLTFPALAIAVACAIAIAAAPSAALTVLVSALFALGIRVSDAAKGALPISLLAPIPTAVGDVGALNRLVWALDAPLLAAAAGAAAASVSTSPFWLIAVAIIVGVVAVSRWRRDFPH